MTAADLYGHDAVYVPVSEEMGLDAGWWPWLLPDPNPVPELVLCPRLERIAEAWAEARLRVLRAYDVLRHGTEWYPEESA